MFEFETPEQKDVRSSVRKLALKAIPPFQNEQHHGTVPRPLFEALAELGLAGLSIPEEYGGIAASAVTSSIVMEELAAVDLGPAIFVSVHAMVSGLIQKFGSASQQSDLLPKLASGEILGAFALTEPAAGSDAGSLRSEAIPCERGFILRGEKCYITSAGYAGVYIVFARTSPGQGSGVTAFIVPSNSKGLTISPPEKKMGCELSPIASLYFNDLFVPSDAVLGEVDRGFGVALGGLAGGRINIAACANGLARAAIDHAIAHLKDRSQFGRKLSEFQSLQFMLADMRMRLEAAQLLTWQAARELDADPSRRSLRLYASAAKCFATDAAMAITTDAVQLLGGAGYLRDYQVERLMRDAKMLQIVEGTNQIQRDLIAREMLR